MSVNSFCRHHDGRSKFMVFAHRNLLEQPSGETSFLSEPVCVTSNAREIRIEWGDPVDKRFEEQGSYLILGEFGQGAPRYRTLCGVEPIWAIENLPGWFLNEVADPMLRLNYTLAIEKWILNGSNLKGKKLLERAARAEYLEGYRGGPQVSGILNDFLKSQGRRFDKFIGGRGKRIDAACYAVDAVDYVARWRKECGLDSSLTDLPDEYDLSWRGVLANRVNVDRRDLDKEQFSDAMFYVYEPSSRDTFRLMRNGLLQSSFENCEVLWGQDVLASESVQGLFTYYCTLDRDYVPAFEQRKEHRFAQDLPQASSPDQSTGSDVALTATQ